MLEAVHQLLLDQVVDINRAFPLVIDNVAVALQVLLEDFDLERPAQSFGRGLDVALFLVLQVVVHVDLLHYFVDQVVPMVAIELVELSN